jgi:hypothetical protein
VNGATGSASFSNCYFAEWDTDNLGRSALLVNGPLAGTFTLAVAGCQFDADEADVQVANRTAYTLAGNFYKAAKTLTDTSTLGAGSKSDTGGIVY